MPKTKPNYISKIYGLETFVFQIISIVMDFLILTNKQENIGNIISFPAFNSCLHIDLVSNFPLFLKFETLEHLNV